MTHPFAQRRVLGDQVHNEERRRLQGLERRWEPQEPQEPQGLLAPVLEMEQKALKPARQLQGEQMAE
jgi:hypothetical protein